MLPAIDAVPKGYTIDVRGFLAVITTTMALAFAAGVMVGPTDPSLVTPILTLLGVPLPEMYAPHHPAAMAKAVKTFPGGGGGGGWGRLVKAGDGGGGRRRRGGYVVTMYFCVEAGR